MMPIMIEQTSNSPKKQYQNMIIVTAEAFPPGKSEQLAVIPDK